MSAKILRWERRPDERPAELLDAALRIFAERGYANTRLDDIAAAVGVTKGTVYHYFATKDELLLRAIEHYHEQAFQPLRDLFVERSGPVSATIRLFLRRAFGNFDSARRAVLTLLIQGFAVDVPPAYYQWLETGPIRAWDLLAQLIEDGKATGEFRLDADSEVAARVTLSGLMLQFAWQRHAEGAPGVGFDSDRLIDSAADLLLHSLRPSGAPTRSRKRKPIPMKSE